MLILGRLHVNAFSQGAMWLEKEWRGSAEDKSFLTFYNCSWQRQHYVLKSAKKIGPNQFIASCNSENKII